MIPRRANRFLCHLFKTAFAAVTAPYGRAGRGINAILVFLSVFAAIPAAAAGEKPSILGYGDSLMAGYGLVEADSFTVRLQRYLEAAGYPVSVINAGVSGDTSAGGVTRMEWVLVEKPDIVLLELGANDGLRGLDPTRTKTNLATMIEKARASGAIVVLAGMKAPRNLGAEYAGEFDSMYPDLAAAWPDILFYPFFLEGVAAVPALNQADGIHPNPCGVDAIVARIAPILIEALNKVAGH